MSDSHSNLYSQNYGNFVGSEYGYAGFRNKLRIKKFLKIIEPKPNEKILEIGCNKGLLLSKIQEIAPLSCGIDVNKEIIKALDNSSISYMSATDLKFQKDSFDKVCAFEVIEHIENICKVFEEVYKILKSKGIFIISFPLELIRGQGAITDAWKIYKDFSYARKLHIHNLTPKKIKVIAEPLGFDVINSKIVLIPFPSFEMKLRK